MYGQQPGYPPQPGQYPPQPGQYPPQPGQYGAMPPMPQPGYGAMPPTGYGAMPPMGGYGPRPVLKEKARGYGIDQNEYYRITQCAMDVYQRKMVPYSTHTANAIKQMLGGDWVVVCYPEQRNYDFALTVVKGGDFMNFTLDNVLFQVCRLR